ncbi:hypothetical protein GCM10011575_01250 [Microlunatus endophyticus]|uniref:Uncharacterized protein n=1 Tax=Microlunatus endophyticus TaxID=1716077 RepID=A0A917VZ10_9ACTN|nr:hypothetical protein [Microlunatus endophyticus]GGL47195.1 hypothetical protein GCM10011575_01250 [Microlunatus endophyticus]
MIINLDADRLSTRSVRAGAGRSGAEVLDLLEHEFVRLLTDRPEPDAGCRAAITLLRSARSVTEVADCLGVGQSTLAPGRVREPVSRQDE